MPAECFNNDVDLWRNCGHKHVTLVYEFFFCPNGDPVAAWPSEEAAKKALKEAGYVYWKKAIGGRPMYRKK